MLALKAVGLKKTFSQDPLNVTKLRKEDAHRPEKSWLKALAFRSFTVERSQLTEMLPVQAAGPDRLLLFVPGGGFVYGPTALNWKFIARLARNTQNAAWLVDYPKAPETHIQEIADNIDAVYAEACKQYAPGQIILVGDSAGGNLILSLVQRLILAGKSLPLKVISITAVVESSLNNPRISAIDPNDPILSRVGVRSANRMAAGILDVHDPIISPLYGSFTGFPETYLFVGGRDILMPDQELMAQKMQEAGVKLEVIHEPEMPHVWPQLPVMKEAKYARKQIETIIKAP